MLPVERVASNFLAYIVTLLMQQKVFFKKILFMFRLPASQPAIRPGCVMCTNLDFLYNKDYHIGL